MATITSADSGLWSAGGTWIGGAAPANNDTVVIASGHTVEFNVDTSGWSDGIAGITITGTLKLTRTSGTYYLKMKTGTAIGGAGVFDCGTGGDAIPFAAKHTITGGANWYITGESGLAMSVYGTEPAKKYIQLSDLEANGQTELSVDTDVRGDIWAAGDRISIVGGVNNAGSRAITDHTIAAGGIAETTITVTPAINANKVAGSYIILLERNVIILTGASSTNEYTIYRMGAGKFTMGSGLLHHNGINKNFFNSNARNAHVTITGGVARTYTFLVNSPNSTISNMILVGGRRVLNVDSDNNILDNCTILGFDQVIASSGNIIKNSTIAFCGSVISHESGIWNTITDSTIRNTTAVTNVVRNNSAGQRFINCTMFNNSSNNYSAAVNHYNCKYLDGAVFHGGMGGWYEWYAAFNSYNHNQVAGAYYRVMASGSVASDTGTVPAGHLQSYKFTFIDANYLTTLPVTFTLAAGKSVSVEVQLRKTASMAVLPAAYLMESIYHPIPFPDKADESFTMTDSTNTWEQDTFSITNSTDFDKEYTLWFTAKNANGNVFAAYKITAPGGGGLLTHPGMTGGMHG